MDFVVYAPGMLVVCLQIASWTNSHFGLTYHTAMKTAANSQADPKPLPWQWQHQLEKQGRKKGSILGTDAQVAWALLPAQQKYLWD